MANHKGKPIIITIPQRYAERLELIFCVVCGARMASNYAQTMAALRAGALTDIKCSRGHVMRVSVTTISTKERLQRNRVQHSPLLCAEQDCRLCGKGDWATAGAAKGYTSKCW